MARVERTHWWYRGLRDAVARTVHSADLPDAPRVLDAGCGTGENLRMLRTLYSPSYLGGFDASTEALQYARSKAPDADVYAADICDPVLHVEEIDLLVSLDVIYIPGAERALAGLKRLVAALAPGGLFVLNLPAYNWLYSEHDVAIHTSERYTAGRVGSLLETLGLSVSLLTYRLFFLFPVVVLSRLPGMWRARSADPAARSDLHSVPAGPAQAVLFGALRAENALIARGLRLPWGSSVFAVGRKP